jgi:cyclic pyranopterin phosphate synthase
VLEGIDAAAEAGLAPVKINMVVKRSVNEHELLPTARRVKGSGHVRASSNA